MLRLLRMPDRNALIANPLSALAFAAGMTFFNLLAALYWGRMTRGGSRRELHGGAGSIMTLFPASLIALAGTAGEYFHLPQAGWWAAFIPALFCLLIAFEACVRLFCRLTISAAAGKTFRPVFDSYFFGILRSPGEGWRTFTDVLGHPFGFDLAEGWFFRIVKAALPPLLLLAFLLLYSFSTPVILEPAEQAVVLRFGRLTGRLLEPGLHFKAPWPFETVRKFNVAEIRRLHVGSHRPRPGGTEIYLADQAILWMNQHGVMPDELLIVAPPADLLKNTGYSGGVNTAMWRVPSVSLAGIDVVAEYRINNLGRYVLTGAAPDEYFRALAEQAVSRLICRYDIDVLFCDGRLELAGQLMHELVPQADKLGLELLHVSIGGAHPPQTVAEAFQDTVAAIQEKETTIQLARQYAIRSMIETAGSMALGEKLLAAVLEIEHRTNPAGSSVMPEALARASEGQVAQMIAEAQAYRCTRENLERGNVDRFRAELNLFGAGPDLWQGRSAECHQYKRTGSGTISEMAVADPEDPLLRPSPADVRRPS